MPLSQHGGEETRDLVLPGERLCACAQASGPALRSDPHCGPWYLASIARSWRAHLRVGLASMSITLDLSLVLLRRATSVAPLVYPAEAEPVMTHRE